MEESVGLITLQVSSPGTMGNCTTGPPEKEAGFRWSQCLSSRNADPLWPDFTREAASLNIMSSINF